MKVKTAVVCLFAMGCSGSDTPRLESPDAAAASDTGDSGSSLDAGATPDSGAASDAAINKDSAAVDGGLPPKDGGTSTDAAVSTSLSAPGSLTAVAGSARNSLNWAAVTGATSYEVLWKIGKSVSTADQRADASTASYVHRGLATDTATEYCYRVRAKDSTGVGPLSAEACATPKWSTASITTTEVSFPTASGNTKAFMFRPASASGAIATVAFIHGGFADEHLGKDVTKDYADAYVRQLASEGYQVFAIQYRWSYFGGTEMLDVAGAYDYLKTRTDVNPQKLALMGHSHGGYMTSLGVMQPSAKRAWTAAVAFSGLADMQNLCKSQPTNEQCKETQTQLGAPGNNTKWDAIDPVKLVGNLERPLLLVMGGNDSLKSGSDLLDQTLTAASKAHQYNVVPNGTHGLLTGDPLASTSAFMIALSYLDAYLK